MVKMVSQYVCMDTSSDGWEEEFFNCLGQDSQEGEAAEDDDSDESGPLEANSKVEGYKYHHWKKCSFFEIIEGAHKNRYN